MGAFGRGGDFGADGDFGTEGETAARSVLRQALAALVAPAGEQPQPQDLADVLWISELAGLAPLPDSSPERPTNPPPAPRPPSTPEHDAAPPPDRTWQNRPGEPEPPAPMPPQPDPKVELHPRCAPAGTERPGPVARGAEVVQVTRPTALPGALAIARALRPLRRPLTQHPGGFRRLHLDEEATATATAETGVLLPVWHRARPRYAVDLLIDTGATMAVWHDLAGELATLLERHGAFEEVRTWSLDTDRDTPHLTPFRRRRTAVPPPAAPDRNWSGPLADPHRRRILLVLTDGVGPAWYGDELVPYLARAASTGPAAALQVLPRRLWHRTALRTAPVEGRAATHGRPAPVLRTGTALPGIPRGQAGAAARAAVRWLPVLEIDADWLAPWADLTAGRTAGWTPLLAAPLSGVPRPQRPRARASAPRTAADRVAAFRAGSSPAAYRLACHLAAAPLSLPVMRLVQRATVPESGQRELAELFLSGLIEVRAKAVDPDEVVYDFVDGVREELLGELTRTESVRVLDQVLAKVSGRVAATFGGTLDFRALAASAGEARHQLPERSRPFAEVAATVLAGAGGQHAALARYLGSAVADRGIRTGLLTPVPPVVSPPDPPRMIGRERELRLLAQACRADGSQTRLVVVEASPGMGRRRLVQEYVRRHGGRHSFVHWIEGRSADALGNGFERLRVALGAKSYTPLDEVVGDHPDWLIVVDALRPDSGYLREILELIASESGCLIVTTGSRQGMRFLADAQTITLGFLTEAELRQEIRHRLGDAYQRIQHAQEFQHLLDRMPRRPDELATWQLDEKLAALTVPAEVDGANIPKSFRLPCRALALAAVPGPDGRSDLAVYGVDGLVHFIDAMDGLKFRSSLLLDVTSDVVAMAAFGDDRFILCTADVDGVLQFWDAEDGSLLDSQSGLPFEPVAMAAHTHSDGRQYLWISDLQGRMSLWDVQEDAVEVELPGIAGGYRAWALTSVPHLDGQTALVGVDQSGTVHRWRPDDPGSVDFTSTTRLDPDLARTIVGIASDEDHCVIASIGDHDGRVHVWELENGLRSSVQPESETRTVGGHFRLVERIARGRQSEIWRARDERDGGTVAVKAFEPNRLPAVLEAGPFLEQVGKFTALRHPGLVVCPIARLEAERLYLVLEFIDGPNLRTVLDAGPLPPDEAAAIALGVAEALEYLHSQGIAHGRVEPANILIRPNGSPALCDFGVFPGDPPGDLYALGTVLHEAGMPEPLHGLVLELLHPDPHRRPSSAAEVARRIAASGVLPQPDRRQELPLRFTLLGEVRAWRGDEPVELGSQERKAVLAALLKYRGRPVRAEVLLEAVREQHTAFARDVDEVWVQVQELQVALNSTSAPRAVLEELSDGHTWVLNVASGQIDVVLFEQALERAEAALSSADPAAARRHAQEALALWQGPPLADLPGPSAELERRRLNELYERARELVRSERSRLRYSLLGPLRVWRDGELLSVGSPQQQAVLAALLLHAPEPVPTASLINAVWGDQPPPQAEAALRTYISRLRSILGDRTQPRGAAEIIQSVSGGFRLAVDRGSIDAIVFEERLAAAVSAEKAGDLFAAHTLVRSALDLWEGPALDGVPGPYASRERTRLTERRLAAVEDLYATGLALGRHEEYVSELEPLVVEHPLRERLCALLMLAFHRCGRQVEALEAYGRLQDRLWEEFAIEPTPVVTRLFAMIQADDRQLRRPGWAEALIVPPGGTAAPAVVEADRLPRGNAPQGVAIGLDVAQQAPVFVDFDANPLFAVYGEEGSGKTALLRLLVKQLTERYTADRVGFLVVDFHGTLRDEVPPAHLVHYAPNTSGLDTLARILRVAATSRTPGARKTAPKDIFLIVDDFELIAANEEEPLASLVEILPQARELGLRVIIARRSEGAGRARAADPFLRAVCDLGPHGVVLSGDGQEGPLLGSVAPQPLPPGRGIHVTPDRLSGTLIQTGWLPARNGRDPAPGAARGT
ncbi:SAV_2336 N-terminal domain-related protein [Kitasatospora cathayae]|uniref:SAV_2336 N-terminal domain-related protein n=1 Tax=Kitasatospora cathayae TaxID=3004092 RepID=A0ABY7PY83_9ACTN|nr:SAV_2336 N-terminal domain-related protein [Kitasatospora sp. HUAS 3-15]WBP85393.1 SAV_2336 N-terminal domain-related protein [Kitasatospora sp. HUAS 3-15]